jgi:replication factor A1
MKINDLKSGMRGVEVTAKLVQKEEAREVMTRYGESRVANALLQDDSGTVKFSLWNEAIDQFNVNDTLKIENGYVTEFRGEIQLNVSRSSKLSVVT